MNKDNAHIDYELITRYLAGDSDANEQDAVRSWLDNSAENRRSFRQLERLWQESGRIVPHEEANVDVDLAWSRFRERVNSNGNSTKPMMQSPETPVRRLMYYATRIAAVLVLGIAGYAAFNQYSTSTVEFAAAEETLVNKLSDGSVVSLNARSALSHPRKFKGDRRQVSLQGEAFFEVEPDEVKPFVVKVEGASITVLGTSFYVKAYDSLNVVEVGVEEGRVKLSSDVSGGEVLLSAGESISIDKTTGEILPHKKFNPNKLFWKSKTLIFSNEPLAEVFAMLEQLYGVDIEVENGEILNCRLSAKFRKENIETILEVISASFDLKTSEQQEHFVITGGGCSLP